MVIDQFIKWLECYPVPNKLQNCNHSINWWLYCNIWVYAGTTHRPG
jgi:hypothetical protein